MPSATLDLHLYIPLPRRPEECIAKQRLDACARDFREACLAVLSERGIALAQRIATTWPPVYAGDERASIVALFVVKPEEEMLCKLYPLALQERFTQAAVVSLTALHEQEWKSLDVPLLVQRLPNGIVLPKDFAVEGGSLGDRVHLCDTHTYRETVPQLLDAVLHDPWQD